MNIAVREFQSAAELEAHYHAVRKRLTAAPARIFEGPKALVKYAEIRVRQGRTMYEFAIGPKRPRVIWDLRTPTDSPRIGAKRIIEEVASKYLIKPQDILGRRRCHEVMIPRHEVFYRLKHETRLSYPQMGQAVGERDHTTAISAVRKYAKLLAAGKVVL